MELWIRSQDRTTLIRSYEIYISEYGKDSYVIRAKRTSHILGAYNTFERALEVLDEIERLLMPKIKVVHNKVERSDLSGFRAEYIMQPMIEDVQVLEASSYVYKMPKE